MNVCRQKPLWQRQDFRDDFRKETLLMEHYLTSPARPGSVEGNL